MNLISVTDGTIALVKLLFHSSLVILSMGAGSVFCGPLGAVVCAFVAGTCLLVPIQDDWAILSKNSKSISKDLNKPLFNSSKKKTDSTQKKQALQQKTQIQQPTIQQAKKSKASLKSKIMRKMAAHRMERLKDERKYLERQKYIKEIIRSKNIQLVQKKARSR